MNNLKNQLLLLLLFFLSSNIYSQIYSKGFVFSSKGDTAQGFVLIPEKNQPAWNCIFKPTMNENIAIMSPADVSGFGTSKVLYVATKFKWLNSDTIMFTQLLYDGIYRLNYYELANYKFFLITRPDSSLQTIRYPPDLTPEDIFSGLNVESKFRVQTDSIFPDAPELKEYKAGVRPDVYSFISLFSQYHSTNRPVAVATSRIKPAFAGTFREGYVINKSNDTVRGFIGNQPRNTVYSKCIFRPGKNESAMEFSPSDINGFGIPGQNEIYLAADFRAANKDTSAFVRLLFDGSIDLLSFKSSGIAYFLLRNSQNQISELIYPPALNKKDYLSGLNSSEKFRILADSVFSSFGINDTPKPEPGSILKSLKKYHRKQGLGYNSFQSSGWEFNAGPVAGVSMLKFVPAGNFNAMKAYSDPAPHLGLYMSVTNNKYGVGFILRNTIGYHKENYSYKISSYPAELFHQTTIKSLVNSLQGGLRISANKIRLNPFVEAGPVFNYYINPEYENFDSEVYSEYNAVLSSYNTREINSTRFFGYFARAGFDINLGARSAVRVSGEYDHLKGDGDELINSGDISATYIIRFK